MMVGTKLMQASLLTEEESEGLSSTAEFMLGAKGRRFRNNRRVKKSSARFGASIFDEEAKQIWFGDIDIEKDAKVLTGLSEKYGPLYILSETNGECPIREMSSPLLRRISTIVIEGGYILYSREFAKSIGIIDSD